jgi:uncharacterized protein YehS (DUF1456 family)
MPICAFAIFKSLGKTGRRCQEYSMTNNDILLGLRYLLKLNNRKIVEICELAGYLITKDEIEAFLKAEESSELFECSDEILAHFLDGLVVLKRGKDPARPLPPVELPVSNNLVLKKLRVAFQLQEKDLLDIFESVGFKITKGELGGLMRARGHPNYRDCGDQILRNFLKGLTLKIHSLPVK